MSGTQDYSWIGAFDLMVEHEQTFNIKAFAKLSNYCFDFSANRCYTLDGFRRIVIYPDTGGIQESSNLELNRWKMGMDQANMAGLYHWEKISHACLPKGHNGNIGCVPPFT